MKLDIRYLNMGKGAKKICNTTFQPETVNDAHEIAKPGFIPYVNLKHVELLAIAIKADDLTVAKKMIEELGL